MSVETFWSEKRWTLAFGKWGPKYTIVKKLIGGLHVGLDVASTGDIPCLISGVVVAVEKTTAMSWCVEIDTGIFYVTYCHLAGDRLPKVGDRIAAGERVGRTARGPRTLASTAVDYPGSSWTGEHCHLVISRFLHAAWTLVKGRTLADFLDPAPIIRSVLATPAGGGAKPLPVMKEWDEMATKQEIKDAFREALGERAAGPVSIVPLENGIYLLSLITGKRARIEKPYHVQLLQRAIRNDDDDKMLGAELDIVAGYLRAVSAA